MGKLDLNLQLTEKILVDFVREEVHKTGFKKVLLGLSGGIDSGIVAYIAAKALGPENVMGIMMPYKQSSKESVEHAKLVIEDLGIESMFVEITPMVDAYFNLFPDKIGRASCRERVFNHV